MAIAKINTIHITIVARAITLEQAIKKEAIAIHIEKRKKIGWHHIYFTNSGASIIFLSIVTILLLGYTILEAQYFTLEMKFLIGEKQRPNAKTS